MKVLIVEKEYQESDISSWNLSSYEELSELTTYASSTSPSDNHPSGTSHIWNISNSKSCWRYSANVSPIRYIKSKHEDQDNGLMCSEMGGISIRFNRMLRYSSVIDV
jgi:hypothetical protein